MNAVEHMLFVPAIPPGVIKDDAAFVSRVIDTALADNAQFLVFPINIGSIDADLAALKVRQSETQTDATTLGGTVTDLLDVLTKITAPGASDDNKIVLVIIDLRQPHGRYVQLQATAGNGAAGTYLASIALFTNVGSPTALMGALAVARG